MNHAGTQKPKVHILLPFVKGERTNRVVGVALRNVIIMNIRIRNHRLNHLIKVHGKFRVIIGIGIRSEGRFFAGTDFCDAFFSAVHQPLKHLFLVVHPLIDHDLDPVLCDFQGLDQRIILRNTN